MSIYPSEQQTEIKIIFNELNLTQKQLELVKKIIKASRNQISSPQDVKEIKLPIVVEFLAQLESKSKRLSNRLKNNPEIKSEQIVTLQKIPSIIKASSQYNQKEITSSSLILTFALPIISLSLHLKSEAELETEYNINFKELVRKLQRYSNPVKNYLKVFFIALLLFFPIIMERITSLEVFLKWELKVFDTLTQRKPFEKPDSHLLIVEVTDDDLQRYGYPIPDNTLSQLINRLQRHQPAIIGINILRLNKVENDDKVIYVCNHQIETNDPNSRGDSAPSDVSNDHIGFSDIIEDSDNVIRRHLLFQKPYATSPCQTPFSFSFLLAAYYLEDKGIEPKTTVEGYTKLGQTVLKKITNHTWEQSINWNIITKNFFQWFNINPGFYQKEDLGGYQLLLNYRFTKDKSIATRLPFNSVMENKFSSDTIKDKVIIVGYTQKIYSQDVSTPSSSFSYKQIPVVELQAQMVSQIISAVLDKRPLLSFFPKWVEFLCINIILIIGGLIAWIFHNNWTGLLLSNSAAIVILVIFSWILLISGYWIPLVRSILAFMISNIGTILFLNKFR